MQRTSMLGAAATAIVGVMTVVSPSSAAVSGLPSNASTANQLAQAIAAPGTTITSSSFTSATGGTPTGVGDTPLSGFPSDGGTFAVLTSGNAGFADDPNSSGNSSANNGGGAVRGGLERDVTVLRLNFTASATANCLSFDLKFLSEEFPEYVGGGFNDAFIAELDATTWTAGASGNTAPNNFAFDSAGNPLSINATGNVGMTAANAGGTTYDGATPKLSAARQVTPGAHALYLSIFDAGDQTYDTAAFVDNLQVGYVPNPAANCRAGAKPTTFSMKMAPATAARDVGTAHTVQATLTNAAGQVQAGAPVTFSVSGANPRTVNTTTDAAGIATLTYTGAAEGSDAIAACYAPAGDGVCAATGQATVNFLPAPALSMTSAIVTEGTGPGTTAATVPVRLNRAVSTPVTLRVSSEDRTADGADVAPTAVDVTFAPGETDKSVTFPVVRDRIDELDELAAVVATNVTGAAPPADAGVTIRDDDTALVRITQAAPETLEGAAGEQHVPVTVTADPPADRPITVALAAGGTATPDEDFTVRSGVTIPPGGSQDAGLRIIGDVLDEDDETVSLTLAAPNIGERGAPSSITHTVRDDDTASLRVGDVTIVEGDEGTSEARVPVRLSTPSANDVTVTAATGGGTATAGADYTPAERALRIPAGETSGELVVTVRGDRLDEDDETIGVALSAANRQIDDGDAVVTIEDDDVASLSARDVTVREGTGGTPTQAVFAVELSTVSDREVRVQYATADGTATFPADYAERTGELVLAAGETEGEVAVPVEPDELDELDETFVLTLRDPVRAEIARARATSTITDDDTAALTLADAAVDEGDGGTTPAPLVVTASTASDRSITVNLTTADGSARGGSDFQPVAAQLTLAPGDRSAEVPALVDGDVVDEDDEDFTALLSDVAGAEVARERATVTIRDDDTAAIAVGDLTVAEGDDGTTEAAVPVTLSTPADREIQVDLATADGTAKDPRDYATSTATLTFPAGAVSGTFGVPVRGDRISERLETFTAAATAVRGGALQDGTGEVTIQDDDASTITIDDVTVQEGDSGTATARFTARLGLPNDDPVAVTARLRPGTASVPQDVTAATARLVLAPGETSVTYDVRVVSDTVDEPDETFTVLLEDAENTVIADAVGDGLVLDDDRDGAFACRASAVQAGSTERDVANPGETPCRDAARDAVNIGVTSDGRSVTAARTALKTDVDPDDLLRAPLATDFAMADARIEGVSIKALLTTISAAEVTSEVRTECTPLGTPKLLPGSGVTRLVVNGRTIASTRANLAIPLAAATLKVNHTIALGTRVIQRALWLDFDSGPDVIVGEARAGFDGNPCSE